MLRHALKLAPLAGKERDTDQELVAVLTETDFKDGVIEVDVAGARRQGYSKAEDVSGFKGTAGMSFRIHEVSGSKARLFVNGATQPCLMVNDLKLGDPHGKIALWARISSEAYFANLRVEAK